jgi:hypothetical protein
MNRVRIKLKLWQKLVGITVVVFVVLYNYLVLPYLDNRLFETQILSPIPKSIKDLKISSDKRVMHGAKIFSFTAAESDIQKIIVKRKLKPIENFPEDVPRSISPLVDVIYQFNNVSWWNADRFVRMKKFSNIEGYLDNEKQSDFKKLIFMFRDGNDVYYITI